MRTDTFPPESLSAHLLFGFTEMAGAAQSLEIFGPAATPAVGNRENMVHFPEMSVQVESKPVLPFVFVNELPIGFLARHSERVQDLLEVFCVQAALGANAPIPLEDLFAGVTGVGSNFPFRHARVGAKAALGWEGLAATEPAQRPAVGSFRQFVGALKAPIPEDTIAVHNPSTLRDDNQMPRMEQGLDVGRLHVFLGDPDATKDINSLEIRKLNVLDQWVGEVDANGTGHVRRLLHHEFAFDHAFHQPLTHINFHL